MIIYESIILQPVFGEVMPYMLDPVGRRRTSTPEEGGENFPKRETREQVLPHAINNFTRLYFN